MRPIPFEDLTSEQQSIARMPVDQHIAAVGAPGSGKTLVLVHRALHLIAQGTPAERILIVTYTNALEAYIAAGLREFGIPESMVISYDALMRHIHKNVTGKAYPRGDRTSDDDHFNGLRDRVHQLLEAEQAQELLLGVQHRWDVILVDETQDLSGSDVENLTMLGRHVTAVFDGRQQLYRRGSSTREILQVLGLRWESVTLLSTFRCSRNVLEIAASVAESLDDRVELPATAARVGENITSLRIKASDRHEEDAYFHAALRARMEGGARSCAVLLPERRWAFGVAKALREAGFAVEDQKSLDLTSSAVKVMTYHSAKGLSFDSVFLPRLYESTFRRVSKNTPRGSLLLVGLTRATTYLFLGTVADLEIREWGTFETVDTKYLDTPMELAATLPVAKQDHGAHEDQAFFDDFV